MTDTPSFPPPPPSDGTPPAGPPPGGTPPPSQPSGGIPDIGAGFSWAWEKFQKNALTLIISFVIVVIAAGVIGAIVYVPVAALFAPGYELTGDGFSDTGNWFLYRLFSAVAAFVAAALAYTLGSNLTRMGLKIADGEDASISDLFTFPLGKAQIAVGLTLAGIFGAVQLIGVIPILGLLSIPLGAVVSYAVAFTLPLFFDKQLAPVDAVKASLELWKTNFVGALVTVLLAGVISSVGLILCFIGVFVSAPFALLFFINQYRQLTGGTITA